MASRQKTEGYDFDGIQLDFARHVPCLPLGRQWELRQHVTDLVRSVRRMLLEVERKRGRPFLLAAKVPQNLKGCRIDGFDVEVWAAENLVDIFTLGSRSMDVDLAAFRRITAGRNIKLQPCFDDHHTTDGYRYAPIEVLRGVFANGWQQGADSVCTFNWSNAPPEVQRQLGDDYLPGPHSHQQAYQEAGSPDTLRFKDLLTPAAARLRRNRTVPRKSQPAAPASGLCRQPARVPAGRELRASPPCRSVQRSRRRPSRPGETGTARAVRQTTLIAACGLFRRHLPNSNTLGIRSTVIDELATVWDEVARRFRLR